MPVLIEAAGDLILIAGVLVLIGMIVAVQHTFVPVVAALAGVLNWVPGAGSLINTVDNALNTALSDALAANLTILDGLFKGLTWSLNLTFTAMRDLASGVDTALHYLRYTTIPGLIKLVHDELRPLIDNAVTRITNLETGTATDSQNLWAALSTASSNAYTWAISAGASALAGARADIATATKTAEAYTDTAVAGVRDLPRVTPKELTDAATAAAVATAAVAATVALAGLDNAECAGKVKQICSTDLSQWENLLAGLALVGGIFSLAELADIARPLVHDLEGVIAEAR